MKRHEESSYRLTVETHHPKLLRQNKNKRNSLNKLLLFSFFNLRKDSNVKLWLPCGSAPTSASEGVVVGGEVYGGWWASNVDVVGVILAQHLVLFGEEGLALQVGAADLEQKHTIIDPAARSFGSAGPRCVCGGGRRRLTAQTKQVSCHLTPRASRNLSPASIGKSQPWQLVPNME